VESFGFNNITVADGMATLAVSLIVPEMVNCACAALIINKKDRGKNKYFVI
jgi:hypothetical protein